MLHATKHRPANYAGHMLQVIKPDGKVVDIVPPAKRGRKAKFPWRWTEVGDHFVANNADRTSIKSLISTFDQVGVVFEIGRGSTPGTFTVARVT